MTNVRTERIGAFLKQVQGRLTSRRYDDVAHYLREEEWELAMLVLPEYLDESDSRIDDTEWKTFCGLAELVGVDSDKFSWLRAESA